MLSSKEDAKKLITRGPKRNATPKKVVTFNRDLNEELMAEGDRRSVSNLSKQVLSTNQSRNIYRKLATTQNSCALRHGSLPDNKYLESLPDLRSKTTMK